MASQRQRVGSRARNAALASAVVCSALRLLAWRGGDGEGLEDALSLGGRASAPSRARLSAPTAVRARLLDEGAAAPGLEAGMSPDSYMEWARSNGYGAEDITRSDDLNIEGVALAVVLVVVAGFALWFSSAAGNDESGVTTQDAKADMYDKWGVDLLAVSEVKAKKVERDEARESLVAGRLARKSSGCRDFWAVDLRGRDRSQYNDSYSLINHIIMASDSRRVEAYRSALQATASDRQVLDVGTGAFCLLGRLALRARARGVDCVEQSHGAVEHAIGVLESEARGVACEGLREIDASLLEMRPRVAPRDSGGASAGSRPARVQFQGERELRLFEGFSSGVELDRQYGLVVHEILGHIASSEGVADVILDLSRRGLLAPDCVFVPRRAATLFAPTEQITPNASEQFVCLRHPSEIQDLKVSTKYHAARFSPGSFLAAPAVFEDLCFGPDLQLSQSRTVEFTTQRDGVFDGLHFHMEVDLGGGAAIDTLAEETSWQTTYVRLFDPGVQLPAGSRILCETSVRLDRESPEYAVDVTVPGAEGGPRTATFAWSGST